MKLYSYCLRYDDGAAPNPFWGICTLVICKPAIRRTAEFGDWIVGHGSKRETGRDQSDEVIYAMKVTRKMTMREYDDFCKVECPEKIPEWANRGDNRRRFGDCIYDYSNGEPPNLRPSVHTQENVRTDLSGQNGLLSDHFYYFGNRSVSLPPSLRPIIHDTQGHKSNLNQPYVAEFVDWIESLGFDKNKPYGEPLDWGPDLDDDEDSLRRKCARRHLEADKEGEEIWIDPE